MKLVQKFLVLFMMILISSTSTEETKVMMSFQGVEIEVFLQWFSRLTGKKILFNSSHANIKQKKIYLISEDAVPKSAALSICMSILENNGFTLIKSGEGSSEVYKLAEISHSTSKPIVFYNKEELEKLGDADYYVSQLIFLKYLKVNDVVASLKQAKILDSGSNGILEIKASNAIIVSDFLPNIKKIINLIKTIDIAPPKIQIEFIALQHAKARDIAERLQKLFANRNQELSQYNVAMGEPAIIPDIRTNSLTLRGNPEDIQEIKRLINHYDQEIKGSEITPKIYHLRHATPDKIMPTLKDFVETSFFKDKDKTIEPKLTEKETSLISIIPNEYSKTLLITASEASHRLLKGIIEELDIRRPQVLLEALICEFTPKDTLNFGIELMALDNITKAEDGTFPHAYSSFGLSSIVDSAGKTITMDKPGTPSGRSLSQTGGLNAFITKDRANNIPLLIQALRTVTNTEVISIPRILTDDGEKAEIRVQDEEPVTSTNALNTSTTTTSFKEFVSAGTVLMIKPHIIHDRWLRLEIEQNIEAFTGKAPSPGIPPPKSSRVIKTVVSAPDGHTVVLGGLFGRREIEIVEKIPVLGDIPLLGLLFQSRIKTVSKTNLYIFITPKILNHPEFQDLKKISDHDKMRVEKVRQKLQEKQEENLDK